jgi:hypothetical protein
MSDDKAFWDGVAADMRAMQQRTSAMGNDAEARLRDALDR